MVLILSIIILLGELALLAEGLWSMWLIYKGPEERAVVGVIGLMLVGLASFVLEKVEPEENGDEHET